jgi:hypothetical protein
MGRGKRKLSGGLLLRDASPSPAGVSVSVSAGSEMNVMEQESQEWRLDGELHREDGPAIEGSDGAREWFLNSKRHREDGPAIERADGKRH